MKRTLKRFSSIGRFLFVWLVLISAFVFAMFQGGQVSWTIFYSILPFILYSILLFLYPIKDINFFRSVKVPVLEDGGKLIVSLRIKRKWRFPLLYTVISEKWQDEERVSLKNKNFNKLFLIGFRKDLTWDYEIERMPRGEHIIEGVSIEITDFFGWIRKTRFIKMPTAVLVYPRTTDIQYVSVGSQYDQGTMTAPFNLIKDTTLATGVRNYQTGDRVSWIHWKSFARTQTLMTKEFEDKRSQELTILLDGRPSELFEEQVTLTASILKELSKQQTVIGFLSTGKEQVIFPSVQHEEDFRQVQVHLAKIMPSNNEFNIRLNSFGNILQSGGSLLVITGDPDWTYLQSIASHVKNTSSIICFAVTNHEKAQQKDFIKKVELAKTKGIAVHILTQESFSKAFKEVKRL